MSMLRIEPRTIVKMKNRKKCVCVFFEFRMYWASNHTVNELYASLNNLLFYGISIDLGPKYLFNCRRTKVYA